MKTDPVKEHQWLQRFVGEWTYSGECDGEPGQEKMKFTGTESVRMIGDLWLHAESTGEMPGGGMATMVLTLGYDPAKERFVGSWVGSMMTHLFVYEGRMHADGKTLPLDCEGPDCMNPGMNARYQDIHELVSDDRRLFRSQRLGEDGKWTEMMRCEYRRVK